MALIAVAAPSAGVAAPGGWTVASSPNPSTASNALAGASCATATSCVAVGGESAQALIERYNEGVWSSVSSPNVAGSGSTLNGVACVTSAECWAVGFASVGSNEQTLIEHGTSSGTSSGWQVESSPNPSSEGDWLGGVTCVSAADCWAVGRQAISAGGRHEGTAQPLVEHYEGKGHEWSVVATASPPSPAWLFGVSCTGAADCWAVGVYFAPNPQPLIEHWNGNVWGILSPPSSPESSGLSAVACVTTTFCVAVGSQEGNPLIEQYNGTAWSIVTSPNLAPRKAELFGVSCATTAFCVAVGQLESGGPVGTLIEQYNGSGWSVASSANPGSGGNFLYGVSCTSGCFAVGLQRSPSANDTLIEQYGPDESTTSVTCSPNPDGVNAPTTCAANVLDPLIPRNTPSGTVAFTSSASGSFGNPASCTLTQTGPETASCQVTYTPSAEGTQTISANYGGDARHVSSGATTNITVVPPPLLTALKPKRGPAQGGVSVNITGANLASASAVKFGSVNTASFKVNSASSITAVAPAETPGVVDVTVTTAGGTTPISLADRFAFTPTVTGLSPSHGAAAGGTSVIVTGTGFALGTSATKFRFGLTRATSVNCTSSTECAVIAPAHAAGAVDVMAIVNKVASPINRPGDQFTYE